MRTLLVGVIAGVFFALLAVSLGGGEVSADNPPHVAGAGVTADSCAGCHRAHTGQAADLLKEEQSTLCYSCHGPDATGSNLDVEDGQDRNSGAALRGGGFGYAAIDSDDDTDDAIGALATPEAVTSEHDVGDSGTVWGFGSAGDPVGVSFTLQCGSCHDPHGNGQFRILRTDPYGTASTPQPTVQVPDQATPVYGTTDYFDIDYVSYSKIASWCSNCHTRYLAPTDSHETPLSGETVFTYRHESDGTGDESDEKPACIKCHVAHGTNATTYADAGAATPGFSAQVPWPGGATPEPTPGGNSRLLKMDNRGICQKCHDQ